MCGFQEEEKFKLTQFVHAFRRLESELLPDDIISESIGLPDKLIGIE